jgi:hypothetical protein
MRKNVSVSSLSHSDATFPSLELSGIDCLGMLSFGDQKYLKEVIIIHNASKTVHWYADPDRLHAIVTSM